MPHQDSWPTTLATLREIWRERGATARPACSAEQISHFERSHRVALSDDFKAYLSVADGMAVDNNRDHDERGFSFSPLSEWTSVSDELESQATDYPGLWLDQAFVFADYMTKSWSYAVCLSQAHGAPYGEILRVGAPDVERCAPSFQAFMEMYVADSPGLYSW